MNEQIFFDLGKQRYSDDIARGERNYAQQAVVDIEAQSVRDRIALGLVKLAASLQPSLAMQVQRPAQHAAA